MPLPLCVFQITQVTCKNDQPSHQDGTYYRTNHAAQVMCKQILNISYQKWTKIVSWPTHLFTTQKRRKQLGKWLLGSAARNNHYISLHSKVNTSMMVRQPGSAWPSLWSQRVLDESCSYLFNYFLFRQMEKKVCVHQCSRKELRACVCVWRQWAESSEYVLISFRRHKSLSRFCSNYNLKSNPFPFLVWFVLPAEGHTFIEMICADNRVLQDEIERSS